MPCKTTSTSLQTKSFRDAMVTVAFALHRKIAGAIERRRIRSELHGLDDYMLKDMGITRADIERIANRTYPPR
jgi:uncharacterized protein YjiS (DUF1127 family)